MASDNTVKRLRFLAYREGVKDAIAACRRVQKEPSTLWEETGCWAHAASNCADAIEKLERHFD